MCAYECVLYVDVVYVIVCGREWDRDRKGCSMVWDWL